MIKRLPLHANGHIIAREDTVEVMQIDDGLPPMVLNVGYGCALCDQRPKFTFTKDAVHVQTPCPYPNGITTTVTIRVPSGKLIITDNLPVYSVDESGFAGYNSVLGQSQVIEAMGAVGCAYGPVGNSCPALYRTGPDSYVISRSRDENDKRGPFDGEPLAVVITDLWAYSCADFKDWESRGGDPAALGWSDNTVDVRPGMYRFTHHSGERSFDRDASGAVFAHVEWVGEVA